MSIYTEFLIILLLILVNGLFALSEFALVSSRRAGLALLAKKKVKGAGKAVELVNDPKGFLPSIQIGITLVGMLVGVFSGAGTAQTLKELLMHIPATAAYAGALSLGLVVVIITYLTLIIGELVPKHLALSAPEKIAAKIAWPLSIFSLLCFPLTRFLALSSDVILRILRVSPGKPHTVTEEELKLLLAESAEEGVLNFDERDMIGRILRLADKKVRAAMTSRNDVAFIDLTDSPAEIIAALKAASHSRFIVCDGSVDNVIGIIPVKDILDRLLNGQVLPPPDMIGSLIRKNIRKPAVVPDTLSALSALEKLKKEPLGIALVLDEYGSFEGIITAVDMLEAIVGDPDDIAAESSFAALTDENPTENRPEMRSVMDGTTPIDEIKALLELPDLPAEGTYHTLGGFLLALLKRIPQKGDRVLFAGYSFEVVEMDGRRVGKVRLAPAERDSTK